MKKIKFTLLSVFAVLFLVSCGSDDNGGIDTSKLLGKWYYHSFVVEGMTYPYNDHEDCGKDYLDFLENGIVKNVDIWECEEDVETAHYSVSGNKINIIFEEEESAEWIVKTLNNTTLVVEIQDEDMGKMSAKFTRE